MVTARTSSKGLQSVCAFAPLRLCVESLLHWFSSPERERMVFELRLSQPIKLGAAGSGIRNRELGADYRLRIREINPGHGRG